jgi:anti-anti-sigma factor
MTNIVTDRSADAAIVSASGEVDAFVAPELEAALADVDGDTRLVVDLARVTFMDSTALGAVVRAARECDRRGVSLRVLLPQGLARRIFEITALYTALPVAESREDALAELGD